MKKKLVLGTILAGMLLSITPVDAKGTAKVSFVSDNEVKVGDTFTVKLQVSDIKDTYDGVVSMSGRLSFDQDIIEFVSAKGIETPYQFQMNERTMMIAGLDFTLKNGFYDTLTVYEFTFKAIQEGTSNITLEKSTLTDSKGYITNTVVNQEIEVKEENTIDEIIPTEEKTSIVLEDKKDIAKEENVVEVEKEEKVESSKEEKPVAQEKTTTSDTKKAKRVRRIYRSQKFQRVVKDIVLKLKNLF